MAYIRHATLVAATVTTFTFTDTTLSRVEILNRDGAAEVFVSFDSTATPAAPVVEGNDFDIVPAAINARLTLSRMAPTRAIVVKVISAGTPKITVRGLT